MLLVGRSTIADMPEVLQGLRAICGAFPEVSERPSHGAPTWFVRGKSPSPPPGSMATTTTPSLTCGRAAPPGVQEALVSNRPDTFFRPPYVGHCGWLGVRLDRELDWDQMADLRPGTGYWYIHNAVDDRLPAGLLARCYTDERKETAAGFWRRANDYFDSVGITVTRVLTDNGSCYRSHAFGEALGEPISHKRTRPYRPQTNGKVERFNRTMLEEWAYAQPYTSETERAAAFPVWLHTYNHHRGHTALGGQTPADLVPNLCGQNN